MRHERKNWTKENSKKRDPVEPVGCVIHCFDTVYSSIQTTSPKISVILGDQGGAKNPENPRLCIRAGILWILRRDAPQNDFHGKALLRLLAQPLLGMAKRDVKVHLIAGIVHPRLKAQQVGQF